VEIDMRAVCLLLIAFALALPARAQQAPQSAVPVGTVLAERKPITNTRDFVGRVEAINRVEIRARVKGYLEAVLFKEGDLVDVGAPLYRIEQALFQAEVDQAKGALERSTASLQLAVVQRQRAQELYQKSVGTAVALDQAVAVQGQATGQKVSDQASLDTAEINLGYTDIKSPIAGRVSRTNVTIGNVVGPDSGSLTMIVSQDPMYVTFPVSQREFLRSQEAGTRVETQKLQVRLKYADGSLYDQIGTIDFVDVTVDRATDTVLARATVANPSNGLIDGQLVRVVLESDKPKEMVVVPAAALIADQEGIYVFIVTDGKAAVKRVKPGNTVGTNSTIEEGLSGGEQVIVEGLQGVRPGTPVQASPAQLSLGQG
jgi:membrane fusion protein (multidrug efflux system)